MHLVEEQWSLAYEDFFEAFKSYDEAGNSKKVSMAFALMSLRAILSFDRGSNVSGHLPEVSGAGKHADEVLGGPLRCPGSMCWQQKRKMSLAPPSVFMGVMNRACTKACWRLTLQSKPYKNDPQLLAMTNLVGYVLPWCPHQLAPRPSHASQRLPSQGYPGV